VGGGGGVGGLWNCVQAVETEKLSVAIYELVKINYYFSNLTALQFGFLNFQGAFDKTRC